MKREINNQLEREQQSWMETNTNYKHALSLTKETHDAIEANLASYQDIYERYMELDGELHKRLTFLSQKVKGQQIKIGALLKRVEEQIAVIKRIEVDIGIKIRSCRGSCEKHLVHKITTDNYNTWKKYLLEAEKVDNGFQMKDLPRLRMALVIPNNVTSAQKPPLVIEEKKLGMFERIGSTMLHLEESDT
ncbi:fibrinogen alpha chain-like [Ambystoma mexicanum]|uniref:fibrinogen alpha chain-like n=1 Tax=Ambystoma mexicanum TaxID=8296 RepID=UPI0037E8A33A